MLQEKEHISANLSGMQSANGQMTKAAARLYGRFEDRLLPNRELSRAIVSTQGNHAIPGFRWFRYREGFSWTLMEYLLGQATGKKLIDPFSGVGTAPFAASSVGGYGVGIELMPVGVAISRAIAAGALVDAKEFRGAGNALLRHVKGKREPEKRDFLKHIPITHKAFSPANEKKIALARGFLRRFDSSPVADLLSFACMSVLEACSYTHKDGQFLRWDCRSGRDLRCKQFRKGRIFDLETALQLRLCEMEQDMPRLAQMICGDQVKFYEDSCFSRLRDLPQKEFDMAITSPPYANRYDYSRTYALELIWLGYEEAEVRNLRQKLLSSTVENLPKKDFFSSVYNGKSAFQEVERIVSEQEVLENILARLRGYAADKRLPNRQVIRLLENYFLEMGVVIAEMARIMRPGAKWFMVNDNVQYSGEEVPVDLILSDMAESLGFRCESIWVLPRGKGNASQQMGRFGRRELRKCVYSWERQ